MNTTVNRFEQPVLILGIPFSGIDQVVRLLHKHNMWLGKSNDDWDITEPRFHFENPVIRSQVNQKILGLMKGNPFQIDKIPDLATMPIVDGLKPAIKGILNRQGYDNTNLWGYKDYRLSLLWPIWLKIFPNAQWVIVRRPHSMIVDNCLKIYGTRKISQHEHYWYNWCEIYDDRLQALKVQARHCSEIDANALQYGEFDQLQSVLSTLDMTFDRQAAKQISASKYWGSTLTYENIN